MEPNFVHLRVHTAYSLAEGAIKIKALASHCAKNKYPAIAMTDTSTLAGTATFCSYLSDAGVQPIIGAQVSLRHPGASGEEVSTVVLLAKDQEGYDNLVRLVGEAYLETTDGVDPKVDLRKLIKFNKGIILLTGGAAGPIDRAILTDPDRAEMRLTSFKAAFGDRLYLEIQRLGLSGEQEREAKLLELADKHDVPIVATNEAFFLTPDMHEAHEVLLCIADGSHLVSPDRRKVSPQCWLKSPEEMAELFADLPDALANTVTIAKRCCFVFKKTKPILPEFPGLGEGRTEADELRAQAHDGLEIRLAEEVFGQATTDEDRARLRAEYTKRLDFELDIIVGMKFPGYFLIVSDFIKWAKANSIPVGPGRGSGAGSVVAWSLQITDLDPIRYGLLFERFLNPERVSMPDFDVDFCQKRREEVINYVRGRYGEDRVAQIGTLGKLQARAVVRDVGRVLQVPFPVVNRFCSLIPNNPADPVTLEKAMTLEPLCEELAKAEPMIVRLFEIAIRLEGLYRNASTHAAGVVIAGKPVAQMVPVMRDQHGAVVTQFDMKSVEDAGLVKFDFLGLKTLDVIDGAVDMIRQGGDVIDMRRIGVDDAPSYAMLARADSFGVFQLESTGMRSAIRQVAPNRLEDIIALVSLYRPGPMDNIPIYGQVKRGEIEPDYMHPLLEPILTETFGIMIYQEQVMQVAQVLAGYSLGGADLLRRAMGKKIKEEMDKQRATFIEGAVKNGVDPDKAGHIFDQVDKFAGYGFNKSHAAAYALIAYHTAYLKCHYPHEFYASSMNLDISNVEKLAAFRHEARKAKLTCLPPDVNKSDAFFTVSKDRTGTKAIRWALAAIRGLGADHMEMLIKDRTENGPYRDLDDLVKRTVKFRINRKAYEGLIRSGALDSFKVTRAGMLKRLDSVLKEAMGEARAEAVGQASLFGGFLEMSAPAKAPVVPEMPKLDFLQGEYDSLGLYISGHPLDDAVKRLRRVRNVTLAEALDPTRRFGSDIKIGVLIVKVQIKMTKTQEPMAILTLSDPTGMAETVAFGDDYHRLRPKLKAGEAFVLTANVGLKEGEARLYLRDAEPLLLDAKLDH